MSDIKSVLFINGITSHMNLVKIVVEYLTSWLTKCRAITDEEGF